MSPSTFDDRDGNQSLTRQDIDDFVEAQILELIALRKNSFTTIFNSQIVTQALDASLSLCHRPPDHSVHRC